MVTESGLITLPPPQPWLWPDALDCTKNQLLLVSNWISFSDWVREERRCLDLQEVSGKPRLLENSVAKDVSAKQVAVKETYLSLNPEKKPGIVHTQWGPLRPRVKNGLVLLKSACLLSIYILLSVVPTLTGYLAILIFVCLSICPCSLMAVIIDFLALNETCCHRSRTWRKKIHI